MHSHCKSLENNFLVLHENANDENSLLFLWLTQPKQNKKRTKQKYSLAIMIISYGLFFSEKPMFERSAL